MTYPKFSDLQQAVMDDQDLNEETFIQPPSFKNYFNEAVTFIEAKIHTLYEDYFMSMEAQDSTQGQTTLDLPENIYANKIRKIYWFGDAREDRYEIKRMRDLHQTMFVLPDDRYRYVAVNTEVTGTPPTGTRLTVYPTFRDTTTGGLIKIYYLRGANRYEDEDSICDIPEFSEVVKQYVVYKCKKKEGHPLMQTERDDLMEMINTLVETLKQRMPDENDELLRDMSFYEDYDPYYLMF